MLISFTNQSALLPSLPLDLLPPKTHSDNIMDDIFINLQTQYAEPPADFEETISLTDFPISPENMFQDRARPSSQPSDQFFEFFTGFTNSDMSHAEDMVFCGKLTFKETHHHQQQQPQEQVDHRKLRRRSESMSELKTATTLSHESTPMRSSRSLDYKKLNRNSSMSKAAPETVQRNSSGKFDVWGVKVPKPPRWFVLMFGVVKLPPEMDLRDIKNRQVRRTGSTTMFSSFDTVPVHRSSPERKSSWGLLDVLGCQGSASVAVTASFTYLPKD